MNHDKFLNDFYTKNGFKLTDDLTYKIIVHAFALNDNITKIDLSSIDPVFRNMNARLDNNLSFYNTSSSAVPSLKKDYTDFTIYLREKSKELLSKED